MVLDAREVSEVIAKGVFHTFTPTTFDVIVNTGDVSLIEAPKLRSELAAVFAFRTDIVEHDLHAYNEEVHKTLERIATVINLRCLLELGVTVGCLRSTTGFTQSINDFLILQRVANTRLFHLRVADEQVSEVAERIDELLK
ncbi:hypothetical protein [Neolewinella antarctica]|uniref:Uncharacterized protein n=1 Tax=Neolewinella antarctica TaxID=442734 RepID=A0ABX0X6S0_9BACT|nr:hypothetical protein [Neolewinella antarctica]NJC24910.1 hypothetical protein [Neolewinella antarctica]